MLAQQWDVNQWNSFLQPKKQILRTCNMNGRLAAGDKATVTPERDLSTRRPNNKLFMKFFLKFAKSKWYKLKNFQ